jgi:hypothetical protein
MGKAASTARRFALLTALALSSVTIVSAQSQGDPALQGAILQTSDGIVYIYKDGIKHQIDIPAMSDDDISSIPAGLPVQRVTELFASTTPSEPPAPAPAPTPAAKPGDVLYQADWSNGLNGWISGGHWSVVNGMLVNTGEGVAFSPYRPNSPNYAVEAEIQVLHPDCSRGECVGIGQPSLGVLSRANPSDGMGYGGGANLVYSQAVIHSNQGSNGVGGSKDFASKPFSPLFTWHTYRVETNGNVVALLIDGPTVLSVTDNSNLQNVDTGVYAWQSAQVQVRNFRILAN